MGLGLRSGEHIGNTDENTVSVPSLITILTDHTRRLKRESIPVIILEDIGIPLMLLIPTGVDTPDPIVNANHA